MQKPKSGKIVYAVNIDQRYADRFREISKQSGVTQRALFEKAVDFMAARQAKMDEAGATVEIE